MVGNTLFFYIYTIKKAPKMVLLVAYDELIRVDRQTVYFQK